MPFPDSSPAVGLAATGSGVSLSYGSVACGMLPDTEDADVGGVHDADEGSGISGGVVGEVPGYVGEVPD